MANRVYWKQLRLILEHAEKYIERYDSQLQNNLTNEQIACINDVVQAIQSCLVLLPVNTPTDAIG